MNGHLWTAKGVSEKPACPACGSGAITVFYHCDEVPVHNVLLLRTREAALKCPKGTISLGFCTSCGFIFNTTHDSRLPEYSSDYEETQSFSETFNQFHRSLARSLIEQLDLHNKEIIEIGCGKGDFITLLCEMGDNRGIGFDPSLVEQRIPSAAKDRVTFIKDFYSENYVHLHADFICCKMTFEHIPDVARFLTLVNRAATDRTWVFFQVPDVARILKELAFWDIYYEHCSYFDSGSLARLFRKCGFDLVDLRKSYHDQYLMVIARKATGNAPAGMATENDLRCLARLVQHFMREVPGKLDNWKKRLASFSGLGKKVVLWGGGSKAVSFLTTLQIKHEIECVVDINPHKHDTFIAGGGQRIVAPEFLKEIRPDLVILLNPAYEKEISASIRSMGLNPKIFSLR